MNRIVSAFLASLVLAHAPAALAEDAAPAQPDVTSVDGKVDALAEQFAEYKGYVDGLRRLKISGYLQARYAYQEINADRSGNSGLYSDASPNLGPTRSNFYLRRGRLKAVYDADWSQYTVQLDIVPAQQGGITIKEGYGTLKLPKGWGVDVGLQLFPFGYEVYSRSSSDLDLLERSRVTRSLLNGEYDLGAAVRGKLGPVNLKVGLFNGNGIDGPAAANRGADNDNLKDVIGRATVDFGWITGGLSGWYGKTKDYSRASTVKQTFRRDRVGADVQMFFDLLPVGGTALKAEWMWGHNTIGGTGGVGGNLPASPGEIVPTSSGWYVLATQNLFDSFQAAARYERYISNHTATFEGNATSTGVKVQDEVQLALHTYVGSGGKVSLAWWHPISKEYGGAALSRKMDSYVVQVQTKF